jgi:hypothetical protein
MEKPATALRRHLQPWLVSAGAVVILGAVATDVVCSQTLSPPLSATERHTDAGNAKAGSSGDRNEFTDLIDYSDIGVFDTGW